MQLERPRHVAWHVASDTFVLYAVYEPYEPAVLQHSDLPTNLPYVKQLGDRMLSS